VLIDQRGIGRQWSVSTESCTMHIRDRGSPLHFYRRALVEAREFWPHILAILALGLLEVPFGLLTPLPMKIIIDSVARRRTAAALVRSRASAAIDSETEALIVDGIERLMTGRTTFMIVHRLGTLRRADIVSRVENGRVLQTPHLVETTMAAA
jgi:ABC-type bacteriocin/lantibiotic exporter with double-glycine peptidase domain